MIPSNTRVKYCRINIWYYGMGMNENKGRSLHACIRLTPFNLVSLVRNSEITARFNGLVQWNLHTIHLSKSQNLSNKIVWHCCDVTFWPKNSVGKFNWAIPICYKWNIFIFLTCIIFLFRRHYSGCFEIYGNTNLPIMQVVNELISWLVTVWNWSFDRISYCFNY